MTKKINLTKMKFLIAALAILSVMSINAFSAPKAKEIKKVETKKIEPKKAEPKKAEWKQISLEPDLDGDGIKDKIDVDYAVEGNNVRLKFTPYIFGEKAKFVKGKSVEKVISKSEFEAKFDTFIKGFISEYPKKSGISTKPNTQAQTQAPNNKKPAETKVNEENKKPAVQNDASKNEKNIKNNTEPQKTTNMEKAQDSIIDKNRR